MKITIETGEETVVFNDVLDVYVALRQSRSAIFKDETIHVIDTTSHSWGSGLREIVKEVRQSLVEMQDILKEFQHGGTG